MAIDEPCTPWPVINSCWPGYTDPQAPEPEDEEAKAAFDAAVDLQDTAVRWASAVLWKRSGRKYSVCTATVRVCPPVPCLCWPCRCGPRAVLTLSLDRPVVEIMSIKNACTETVIDPARYKIIDEHGVGLVDLSCGWTSGMTFSTLCDLVVVFKHGWTPDIEASMAMTQLASEYAKWCSGQNCKSTEFLKLSGAIKRGRRDIPVTGLPLVDHFLAQETVPAAAGMLDPGLDVAYTVT